MSQEFSILIHLKERKSITPLDALTQYGCMRLSARIKELKEQGHNITTNIICKDGKRFAEYSLV